jgi:uroporphyrin-III C-methyltransferase/precorrin-2 dehydrogenase/sirohydrochlorin ferrochelatase
MPFRYPISLELEGRPCVVIGGGEVAEHKARALLAAGAKVAVIAAEFTEGLEAVGSRGRVELVRRSYSRGDLEDAFLAIAATDDKAVNAKIFQEAEERGVLLNAVDDIEHCHFAVPSIVRRADFVLAISTGGKAPALSKRLRMELSEQFGPEYGTLVDLLGEVRDKVLPGRKVDFETWAGWWQMALEQDLVGLVRDGRVDEARDLVRRALTEGGEPASSLHSRSRRQVGHRGVASFGKVSIVGAGPGDPGLITVSGQKALEEADIVVYDRLVHPSLVAGKETIFVGKEAGDHPIPQRQINHLLVRLARDGKRVVRLKGGDPFVFGRGAEEAEALAAAGIEFEVIPAPTSAIAALAYAGIPVTDRRFSSSVAFVTGHCAGEGDVDLAGLATSVDTIVILMGLGRVAEIVDRLIAGGKQASTPGAIIENGTLSSQRVITAQLRDLPQAAAQAGAEPPAIIVVGDVVRLRDRIAWFDDRSFSIRDRAQEQGSFQHRTIKHYHADNGRRNHGGADSV